MKITTRKVYDVEGLPDETFENEADAAVAAILVMLNIDGTRWDIVEEALRANAVEISRCLRIVTEPKNASGNSR